VPARGGAVSLRSCPGSRSSSPARVPMGRGRGGPQAPASPRARSRGLSFIPAPRPVTWCEPSARSTSTAPALPRCCHRGSLAPSPSASPCSVRAGRRLPSPTTVARRTAGQSPGARAPRGRARRLTARRARLVSTGRVRRASVPPGRRESRVHDPEPIAGPGGRLGGRRPLVPERVRKAGPTSAPRNGTVAAAPPPRPARPSPAPGPGASSRAVCTATRC
jgi:hypothetical protein